MTTFFPTRLLHPTPLRVATVTLCLMLGGCTIVGDWFSSEKADYKGAAKRTQPLEVPPDLTQLQRDSRYLPTGGVVAASDLNKPADGPGGTPPNGQSSVSGQSAAQTVSVAASAAPSVALNSVGDVHLEHQGEQRWLTTKEAPETVLPKVRDYWLAQGFTLTVNDPKTGVLETDWKASRTPMPGNFIKDMLGRVASGLFDSGLRDRFRTRLERRPDGGTDLYVTQYGASEELVGFQKSETQWVPRPNDPGLEAQVLSEIMLALGGVVDDNLATANAPKRSDDGDGPAPVARVIPSSSVGSVSGGTGLNGEPRARIVTGQTGATMQVDDNFDRSWRRIGLALDHGGFTVEDRDRAQGLYYVRYVDAAEAAKDEPGFFSKITEFFGKADPSPVNKYRISIKAPADTAVVTVLNDQGQPDNSKNAQRIVTLLVDELK